MYATLALAGVLVAWMPHMGAVVAVDEGVSTTTYPEVLYRWWAAVPAGLLLGGLVMAAWWEARVGLLAAIAVIAAGLAALLAAMARGLGSSGPAPGLTGAGVATLAVLGSTAIVGSGHALMLLAAERSEQPGREGAAGAGDRRVAAGPGLRASGGDADPQPRATAASNHPGGSLREDWARLLGSRYARFYAPLLVGCVVALFVPWYQDRDVPAGQVTVHVANGVAWQVMARPGGWPMAAAVVVWALLVGLLASVVWRPSSVPLSRLAAVAVTALCAIALVVVAPGTGTPRAALAEGGVAVVVLLALVAGVSLLHVMHVVYEFPLSQPPAGSRAGESGGE